LVVISVLIGGVENAAYNSYTPIIISGIGTHSRIPFLAEPDEEASEHGVLQSLFRDARELMALRSFRALFIGVTITFVAFGVSGALGLYTGTYFWKLTAVEIRTGALYNELGIFLGFWIWPQVANRIDKKPIYILGFVIFMIFVSAPVLMKVAGFYPAEGSTLYIFLYNFSHFLWAFGISVTMILGGSMMADITDEDELLNNRRREGVFFGANSFSAKAASGVGIFIAGLVVDRVGLEKGMPPEDMTVDMQAKFGLAVGLSLSVLVGIGIAFFSCYPLNRQSYDEIRAALDARAQN